MTNSFSKSKRIALLLNVLPTERFARRPLVQELLDELVGLTELSEATAATRALLQATEQSAAEASFEAQARHIAVLIRRHAWLLDVLPGGQGQESRDGCEQVALTGPAPFPLADA